MHIIGSNFTADKKMRSLSGEDLRDGSNIHLSFKQYAPLEPLAFQKFLVTEKKVGLEEQENATSSHHSLSRNPIG